LNKKKDSTIFIAIDYNKDFCDILNDKFKGEKNFILINGSAENLKEYLNKYNVDKVDYIVSGLPFASLPNAMSNRILKVTKEILKDKGEFITFQYTLFKMKLFIEILLSFILAMIATIEFYNILIMTYVKAHTETITHNIGILLVCSVLIIGIGTFILCFLLMSNRHIKYINYE
jgi:phospholipid N-methyltransferase